MENKTVPKLETTRSPEAVSLRQESWWRWRRRRFSAIGWGNVFLLALIFLLSSLWSLLLIILNLEPSHSANYILQTESLDHGHFWQSPKAASSIQVTATSLLLVVIGVYWYLLYLLLLRHPSTRVRSEDFEFKAPKSVIRKIPTAEKILDKQQNVAKRPIPLLLQKVVRKTVIVYRSVESSDGQYRKLWNIVMEIPEVILQILSLREHMSQGLDVSLLYCYASLMALNAFVAFYHIQFRWNEAMLQHILKDSIIDAVFAVFFPALILFYSLFVFHEDLVAVKIRQQFFPPRAFERKARNYVNAKELNMFSTDFESLLIRSGWEIFLKLSFSLLACFRWRKITHLLLQREHTIQTTGSPTVAQAVLKSFNTCTAVAPLNTGNVSTRQDVKAEDKQHFVHSRLRALVSVFFLVYGVGCIVYTVVAVQKTQTACSSYPGCVQFAYQWRPGVSHKHSCACLAYVDRDLAPADTDNLTDVTQTLVELAGGGKLETVQLVNRKINGSLPEELQTCRSLRNLVLIHTDVASFPAWTSQSFSKLEYLHIEGDSADINLIELPSDLFSKMDNLHTIHLSYHVNLPRLPSLVGLTALQSVYFGFLDFIEEFPSVGHLPTIQVIALESLPLIRSLPEIVQYKNSLEMVFVQNLPVCCSGFLSGGACNTTFANCCGSQRDDFYGDGSSTNIQDGSFGEDRAKSSQNVIEDDSFGGNEDTNHQLPLTCLHMPEESVLLPTTETLSVIAQYAGNSANFCDEAQATCPGMLLFSSYREEDGCKGVLYRQCTSQRSGKGICFNENMGRVQCTFSQTTIDMRKAEIAAGCKCDELEEKWLGCS